MRIPSARLIVCLAAAGLVAGCASSSAPTLSSIEKNFLGGIGSYDQNRDGVVTCEEWRAAAAKLFAKANRSGSGALTEEEFSSLATVDRTFLVATFKFYDVNADGKIDKAEFVERPNPAFNTADKDKDCRLTDLEQVAGRNLAAPPVSASTAARTRATTGPTAGPGSNSVPNTGPGNNY